MVFRYRQAGVVTGDTGIAIGTAIRSWRGVREHAFARYRGAYERPRGGWLNHNLVGMCGAVASHTIDQHGRISIETPRMFSDEHQNACPRCAREMDRLASARIGDGPLAN